MGDPGRGWSDSSGGMTFNSTLIFQGESGVTRSCSAVDPRAVALDSITKRLESMRKPASLNVLSMQSTKC
jgi:hypothetical protein